MTLNKCNRDVFAGHITQHARIICWSAWPLLVSVHHDDARCCFSSVDSQQRPDHEAFRVSVHNPFVLARCYHSVDALSMTVGEKDRDARSVHGGVRGLGTSCPRDDNAVVRSGRSPGRPSASRRRNPIGGVGTQSRSPTRPPGTHGRPGPENTRWRPHPQPSRHRMPDSMQFVNLLTDPSAAQVRVRERGLTGSHPA